MQPNTPKILILSSDTGGGHRSAAQALTEGLQRIWQGQSIAVRVIKAVEESHHITDKLVGVYNWVLRNKQGWMKYLYWAMNRFRPETREFFQRNSGRTRNRKAARALARRLLLKIFRLEKSPCPLK